MGGAAALVAEGVAAVTRNVPAVDHPRSPAPVHISRIAIKENRNPFAFDSYEPHGCCRCAHPLHVSTVGECQRCYRLHRPGATARLTADGRGELL